MPSSELSDAEVLLQVRALAKAGRLRWTEHAQKRMAERGISKDEVKACLTCGHFGEPPTIPNRFGDIEFKFRMDATVDGERVAVAASLVPETRVVVITVIDLN